MQGLVSKCEYQSSDSDQFAQCMILNNQKIDKLLAKLNWRMIFSERVA